MFPNSGKLQRNVGVPLHYLGKTSVVFWLLLTWSAIQNYFCAYYIALELVFNKCLWGKQVEIIQFI